MQIACLLFLLYVFKLDARLLRLRLLLVILVDEDGHDKPADSREDGHDSVEAVTFRDEDASGTTIDESEEQGETRSKEGENLEPGKFVWLHNEFVFIVILDYRLAQSQQC